MGVVYAAYDPQLDRKVALKVLHTGAELGMGTSDGRGRLLREAQAMAKLSHNNVITVHDVGTFGDRVFVAMEFIDGSTLRDWLASPHDWPDVVEAFVKAGRGLAAAHAAGLVHRDFKPDNVLIGSDGRVLVMDFGLARQTASGSVSETSNSGDHSTPTPSQPTNLVLTRTGALLGTPAYMAPEQHKGVTPDPLADQFSFCVALYEGLYGERPYPGKNVAAIAMSILEGEIRPPPRGTRVPPWLREVVLRGLKLSPQDRFPSMDALLAELQRDPPQPRRPWVGVAVAAGVAATITGAYLFTRPPSSDRCPDAQAALAEQFDPTTVATLRAAFSERGGAGDAAAQVVAEHMQTWTGEWVSQWRSTCAASRAPGTAPITARDVPELRCLEVLRGRMAALAEVLAQPTPATIEHAVFAVERIPEPDTCTERVRLSRVDLDPPEGVAAHKLHELRHTLATADALRAVGRASQARQIVDAAVRTAGSLDDPGLQAEAYLEQAAVAIADDRRADAHVALREAILGAALGDRPDIAAEAWTTMIELLADEAAHPGDEMEVLLAADAALVQAGESPYLLGELEHAIGRLYLANGQFDDAREHLEQARRIRTRHHGADHVDVATSTMALGLALDGLGRFREASEAQLEALSVFERALGPRHRQVAWVLAFLGTAEVGNEANLRADANFARARVILEPSDASDRLDRDELHPASARALADTLDRYGRLRRAEQHSVEAIVMHRRALALLEKAVGAEHRDVGYPMLNLAVALSDGGGDGGVADPRAHEEAAELLGRLRTLWDDALADDHPDRGYAALAFGRAQWLAGDHEGARDAYARALTIWEATLPDDHPLLAYALTGLGRSQLALSNVPEAVGHLERALSIRDDDTEDQLNLAETTLALARALWVTGADPERALELAEQARKLVNAYEPSDEEGLRQLLDGADVPGLTDRLQPAALGTSNRNPPASW
jgi:tetratricopeptide (TPR) repeat protein